GHLPEARGEIPQPLGELGKQRRGEFRAGFDQLVEGRAIDRLQRAVGFGADAREARRLLYERELAEHAARPETLDDLAADEDRDGPFEHDVHAGPGLALLDDRLAAVRS